MLKIIGDYRYNGAVIDGRKYSIVRNGDELQRVREIFDDKAAVLLWDKSMPMTLAVLTVLKYEARANGQGSREGK
jgi:hypothetical protein